MRTCHSVLIALAFLALADRPALRRRLRPRSSKVSSTDPSGAALPGVDIEIRNTATNLTRNVITDREGRFAALQLPSGRYTVTFKLCRLRHDRPGERHRHRR